MKYWQKVVLDEAFVCMMCGEVKNRGQTVHVLIVDGDVESVACVKCFDMRFPQVKE